MGKTVTKLGCFGLIAFLLAGILGFPRAKWLFLPPALALALIVGIFVYQILFPPKKTPDQMAAEIEKFIHGTGGSWDWDDFVSVRVRDPQLDKFRVRCVAISEEFPGGAMGWCNEEGTEELREVVKELRAEADRRRRESINGKG